MADSLSAPAISLPCGGGAIRGIDDRFAINPFTGTASLTVPIATSPGRGGMSIELGLRYDPGTGHGPFGVGWHHQVSAITRKADQGFPRYIDTDESDVFVLLSGLSGPEDLVATSEVSLRDGYRVRRYRPRIEGRFARIECWTAEATGDSHVRIVTRDNQTSIYGRSAAARIADPAAPARVYSWLLEETRDDRGGAVRYIYKAEDGAGVELAHPSQASRSVPASPDTRLLATAQRYLKRIHYGNRMAVADREPTPADPSAWHFEVVFDHGEHDRDTPTPDDDRERPWLIRADPQSSFRAGFEVHTYRLCRRVLMFHRFAELGDTACLVRSTDFTYDEAAALTYLTRVEQAGYTRRPGTTSYTRAALPALELGYTRVADLDDTVHRRDRTSPDGVGATSPGIDLGEDGPVWSSSAPAPTSRAVADVDLLGGRKPHLLASIKNNLGAETQISYASSAQFDLADGADETPWITRLPFAVPVVERVTTYDRISRSRFVTRYTYHHGYYDDIEREFRGFGRVDQRDTEELGAVTASGELPAGDNLDAASHTPPVLTRTWFHTGAFADGSGLSRQLEAEYHVEPGLTDAERRAMRLDDTLLPDSLSAGDAREACRALAGSMLRRELYAQDGSDAEGRPYLASEHNYTIVAVQPRSDGRHGVFFVHPRETIELHYERKLYQVGDQRLADPRIRHSLTLAVDDFGHVLRAVDVAYGRRHASPDPVLTTMDRARQSELHITWTENAYTDAVDQDSAYRAPRPCESRHYEITRLSPSASRPGATRRFGFGEIENALEGLEDGRHDLAFEDFVGAGATEAGPYRRLIGHARTLYRRDDLTGPLPLGRVESRALPYARYQLALTPGLVAAVYGDRVTDPMLACDGGYVHVEGDANWWVPSGRVFYSPRTDDSPAEELDHAQSHFFAPHRVCDPFGQTTQVTYDRYDLLVWQTRDPLGNVVTAGAHDAAGAPLENGNDYRVLQPARMMDPNRNRKTVAFDALGMVVGTAVMGKPEEPLGDSLDRFEADLADGAIAAHLADPLADPHSLLRGATTRLVYDRFAYQRTQTEPRPEPPAVYTLARETHEADLAAGQRTSVQHRLSYSDGFGRVIQNKLQAAPGSVTPDGPTVDPRWVGTGWTIFSNKGNPVRTYEPFFTDSHRFESAQIHGISSVACHDPLGREVATRNPEHTYEKVAFDPWSQASWDVNDNVLRVDPRTDPDVGAWFARLPADEYLPVWHEQRSIGARGGDERDAATKAAAHAGTPSVAHVDARGRTFLTVAHNRFERAGVVVEDKYRTTAILDITGNPRAVIDAKDRIAMRHDHDLLGNRIHQASMEAGERWMLGDAAGKPIRGWDSRGFVRRTTYDELRRPTGLYVTEGGVERLAERTVYGEAEGEAANHRAQIFQRFDAAGIVTSVRYDFKGNLQNSRRDLLPDYRRAVNWLLEPGATDQSFTRRTTYDALNRPLAVTSPDGSVYLPSFNEANLLERVDVQLRGALALTPFVTDIAYDARRKRVQIDHANGARSRYAYDPFNGRLTRIVTERADDGDPIASELFRDSDTIQDLRYTYDPAGNIVRCEDAALVVIIRDGERIDPVGAYTYDAVYRLVEARGREHIAQTALELAPPDGNYRDHPFAGLQAEADDLQALCNYTERYEYDLAGNLASLSHHANGTSWTRRYDYRAASLLEPGKTSNRLTGTTVGDGLDLVESYGHDAHGNMTSMPHLAALDWDGNDELARADLGGGGTAYHVYDPTGQRVRTVIESQAGVRQNERLYLDGFELYREYSGAGDAIVVERESLHVMDDRRRIALVETLTVESGTRIADPDPVQRYQLDNHVGSASIELDGAGAVLSYEDYHPYGTTSFQAAQGAAAGSRKRYRYTGKERDEETGFGYDGARYYAPHLGRWISTDPKGTRDD